MKKKIIFLASVILFVTGCSHFSGNATFSSADLDAPPIVTGDIKVAIEEHIAQEVANGNGYFRLPFDGKELQLKLVRVHVEYLASLSPVLHFACVDMVGADGEFYDVDFFMEGPRGDMKVTETTVHKINGKPLYVWRQAPDKTWGRAPVDTATDDLLGIIRPQDKFDFRYKVNIPELNKDAKLWIPLVQSDQFQTVELVKIDAPVKEHVLNDSYNGNKAIYFELPTSASGKTVEVNYRVIRIEKSAYPAPATEAKLYLGNEILVPDDDEKIVFAAKKAVGDITGDVARGRALYDAVIDQMRYMKYGDGWGKGDAVYACNSLYGNCTDFHAYFIAMARALKIPARFAIGAAIPSERDDGGTDGYHCWAEFYAEGKWWPVDISEANKFTSLSMYYFGHHPANRIEFSRGRDIKFDPLPKSGPINFFAYPIMESADGKEMKPETFFLFNRIRDCN